MTTVYWYNKEILLIEFLDHEDTVNANVHCEMLKNVRHGIQNKICTKLTDGILFLHDNTWLRTAKQTKEELTQFSWEIVKHWLYNPDVDVAKVIVIVTFFSVENTGLHYTGLETMGYWKAV